MSIWNRLGNVVFGKSSGTKSLLAVSESGEVDSNIIFNSNQRINGHGMDRVKMPHSAPNHLNESQNETIYDNKPALGSVVCCQQGNLEHSGIYVGDDMFIHLNSDGRIEKVCFNDFTSKMNLDETDFWFPCNNETGQALGLCTAVFIALEIIDNSEDYHLSLVNSQQFISGCITNIFDNKDHSIAGLQQVFAGKFDFQVVWKCWER